MSDEEQRKAIIARIPSAEDLDLIAIDPPDEWLKEKWPADLGPQRGPASVAQINAQVKQTQRELDA